jgi:hypothetical protein
MERDVTEALPARPLPDDLVDRIAKEVAAQVTDHIEAMYPTAAEAVAWSSASRSIQGVVRNTVAAAGRAAEEGRIEDWLSDARRRRREMRRMRRRNSDEPLG